MRCLIGATPNWTTTVGSGTAFTRSVLQPGRLSLSCSTARRAGRPGMSSQAARKLFLQGTGSYRPIPTQDLRHTFASTAVASGQGMPMIGKLLGHMQVLTTARYAHLAAEPVMMAADEVAQNLRQSLG